MSIDPKTAAGGQPIGVIGVGYVGLVTAVCFADLGFDVICRDINPDRIEALQAGRVPIYEPEVEPVLARNRDRLEFTLDLAPMLAALPDRVRVRGHSADALGRRRPVARAHRHRRALGGRAIGSSW